MFFLPVKFIFQFVCTVTFKNIGNSAVQSDCCKRIFNKEDVFGFKKIFELRSDEISLTEKLLSVKFFDNN